jgi:hypothetical protein
MAVWWDTADHPGFLQQTSDSVFSVVKPMSVLILNMFKNT